MSILIKALMEPHIHPDYTTYSRSPLKRKAFKISLSPTTSISIRRRLWSNCKWRRVWARTCWQRRWNSEGTALMHFTVTTSKATAVGQTTQMTIALWDRSQSLLDPSIISASFNWSRWSPSRVQTSLPIQRAQKIENKQCAPLINLLCRKWKTKIFASTSELSQMTIQQYDRQWPMMQHTLVTLSEYWLVEYLQRIMHSNAWIESEELVERVGEKLRQINWTC